METAIRKAKEGGYKGFEQEEIVLSEWENDEGGGKVSHHFLLDPRFWSSLGKALDWGNAWDCPCCDSWGKDLKWGARWIYEMHRFIDALIAGQTPDSFFDALLNTK